MSPLTKRQQEIFEYISSYIDKNNYSPTYEEIKDNFGLSALSTVHEHITELVNKGYLLRDEKSPRGIAVIPKKKQYMEIPLLGIIRAGKPIEAIETANEYIKIVREPVLKGNLYALKVEGDSMINDGIFSDDIVIAKKQSVADNGDMVVAVIDDNEATLKRFYLEKNRVKLQPANPKYEPIYRKEVEIRGVVIKIIRNLK
ncbi:MAG: transcriptional repressor LexA [Candidatus Margulisbacteria bacterium]|nr:transcriptional repressor LexA [Candidatus Margulisiibacteriota bacterium]